MEKKEILEVLEEVLKVIEESQVIRPKIHIRFNHERIASWTIPSSICEVTSAIFDSETRDATTDYLIENHLPEGVDKDSYWFTVDDIVLAKSERVEYLKGVIGKMKREGV